MIQTIDNIKNIKERIPGNKYSSRQLANLYDKFLYRAFYSIVNSTYIANKSLAACAFVAHTTPKRKLGSAPKNCVVHALCASIIERDPYRKCTLLKGVGLERTAIKLIINEYLHMTKEYSVAYFLDEEEALSIETNVQAFGPIFYDQKNVVGWYEIAVDYQNRLLEKYMRHIVNRVAYYRKQNSTALSHHEVEDLTHNYVVYALKAIDKFDSSKGTLTSYINNWLRYAETSPRYDHISGYVFRLPQDQKLKIVNNESDANNFPVYIEDDEYLSTSVEEDVENMEALKILAKIADPKGFARMALNIEEVID